MICTVFAFLLRVGERMTAVCTVEQTCEHLNLTCQSWTPLGTHHSVCFVPQLLRDYRLMTVLNDYPVLSRNFHFFLTLHRLAPLLPVDKLAEVDLIFKYHSDRSNVPVELLSPVIRLEVIRIMEIEVGDRSENFFRAEDFCGLIVAYPLCRHSEYPSYCLRSRVIYHKVMPVVRVKLVAERRL